MGSPDSLEAKSLGSRLCQLVFYFQIYHFPPLLPVNSALISLNSRPVDFHPEERIAGFEVDAGIAGCEADAGIAGWDKNSVDIHTDNSSVDSHIVGKNFLANKGDIKHIGKFLPRKWRIRLIFRVHIW
ncbi:hypothetical protein ACOSQ3_031872 [Xanthoceras sorbifolium]